MSEPAAESAPGFDVAPIFGQSVHNPFARELVTGVQVYQFPDRDLGPFPAHETLHPAFLIGPTVVYHTQIPALSVGAHVDFHAADGFDYGVTVAGFARYALR